MHFILQQNINENDLKSLIDAIEKEGHTYETFFHIPFDTSYPNLENTTEDLFVYAASSVTDQIFDDYEYELFVSDNYISGFIEGYKSRDFEIIYDNLNLFRGIEDYIVYNIDERYLDEYMIHDLVSGEKYKVLTHEMIKGFISGTVNLKNCGVTSNNMEVFCYRSDNYRHIGTYSVDKDGKYVIPNLDVNSRYDIIFRDKTKKIKDQISNYRKPMKY